MMTPHLPPADWYPDPSGGSFLRYWDGAGWTGHTRPLTAAAASAAPTAGQGQQMVMYSATPGEPAPTGVWRGPIDSRPRVMTMADAVRVCVQKYAQFDGRASRPEFWYAQLTYLLAVVAALFIVWIPLIGWLVLLAVWAFAMASIVPLLAVTVRRLRDAGFHWAWLFLALAPFGSIVLLVFCAQPSKHP